MLKLDGKQTTIERIRSLRETGLSFAAIARLLTAEAHPSKCAGRWLPNTVRRVWLRNRRLSDGAASSAP